MEALPNINFTDSFQDGHGKIIIFGLSCLPTGFFSTLWSKFRKRYVRKTYKIDGAATFIAKEKVIECRIFCNAAYADHNEVPMEIYTQRFHDTFPYWANDFESLLESIVTSNDFFKKENENDDSYADRLLKIAYNYMPFINKKRTAEIYKAAKQDAKLA